MIKTTIDSTTEFLNPHKVDTIKLYDKESAEIVHILLKPGQSLKPHITPVDVFFYILEGNPEIMIGEKREVCFANTLVESPKDIVHCIYNNTDSIARILVGKAPRPTSPTKIIQ